MKHLLLIFVLSINVPPHVCWPFGRSESTTISPFDKFQPETSGPFYSNKISLVLEEFFMRLDRNNDSILDEEDYLHRNRYYVEMTRHEFGKVDQNRIHPFLLFHTSLDDGNLTKQELHDYNQKLKADQHRAQLAASNVSFFVCFHCLSKAPPLTDLRRGFGSTNIGSRT
jgi:hypothetical protein